MSAVLQIPDHFVTKFDTTWRHLVQQTESRLRETVTVDSFDGKEKRYNQIDAATMDLVTGRAQQTVHTDIALPLRWLRTNIYDKAFIQDEWDETFLGEVSSPTSQFMRAAIQAYNRLVDSTIASALGGAAFTGATGTTSTALPSTQKVARNYVASGSATDSGLTLAKLIRARSILRKNEAIMPDERLVLAISQQQMDDLLLNVDQVSNTRYSDIKALQEGVTKEFMGFYFHITQLLPYSGSAGSGSRLCYAYPQSALMFADGGKKSYMDILPTLSHSLQVRVSARVGATRMEEKRVVEIACLE